MEKTIDVVALGELLIDFTQNGISDQGNYLFEANPGGAPCNVLAMLANLNRKCAFIGKVGNDFLGNHLRQKVAAQNIDVTSLVMDNDVHTTLAFVHTMPDGDRDFSFYRNPGADMNLKKEEINTALIENAKIFHFGSLSMTHQSCFEATQTAIQTAQNAGCLLSFDPNLRPPLWQNLNHAKQQIEYGMKNCHILKIADNEITWFTGKNDFDQAVKMLQNQYNIPLILLTLGKEGSCAYTQNTKVYVPGFINPNTIETTGAGDTFCACCLNYILQNGMQLNPAQLNKMLTFANAAASIITTKKGALCVMPTQPQIEEFIKKAGASN